MRLTSSRDERGFLQALACDRRGTRGNAECIGQLADTGGAVVLKMAQEPVLLRRHVGAPSRTQDAPQRKELFCQVLSNHDTPPLIFKCFDVQWSYKAEERTMSRVTNQRQCYFKIGL